ARHATAGGPQPGSARAFLRRNKWCRMPRPASLWRREPTPPRERRDKSRETSRPSKRRKSSTHTARRSTADGCRCRSRTRRPVPGRSRSTGSRERLPERRLGLPRELGPEGKGLPEIAFPENGGEVPAADVDPADGGLKPR